MYLCVSVRCRLAPKATRFCPQMGSIAHKLDDLLRVGLVSCVNVTPRNSAGIAPNYSTRCANASDFGFVLFVVNSSVRGLPGTSLHGRGWVVSRANRQESYCP